MLKQFVLKYRTPEDMAEIADLQAQRGEVIEQLRDIGKAWEADQNNKELMAQYDKAYNLFYDLGVKIDDVYYKAEKRYQESFKKGGKTADEIRAAILGDIRAKIDALQDTELETFKKALAEAEEVVAKRTGITATEKAGDDPQFYLWYMLEHLSKLITFQTDALAAYKINDDETAMTVSGYLMNQAAAWGADTTQPLTFERVIGGRLRKLESVLYAEKGRGQFQELIEGPWTAAASFQHIPAHAPKETLIADDNITKEFFKREYSEDPFEILVKRDKKQDIMAMAIKETELPEDARLTRFEEYYMECVLDAIATLKNAGNDRQTAQQIYRAMVKTKKAKLTPKQERLIDKVIHAAEHTIFTVDLTAYLAKNTRLDSEKVDNWKHRERLLYFKEDILTLHGGHVVTAYHILDKPKTTQIAEALGQVVAQDIALLDTPVSKTPEAIVMTNYLLRRVYAMKHSRNKALSREILYGTIYELLDLPDDRDKRQKVRNDIKKTLEYWCQRGWIDGYTETRKNGRELHGVIIEVREKIDEPQERKKIAKNR